jgi:hypothetical protein
MYLSTAFLTGVMFIVLILVPPTDPARAGYKSRPHERHLAQISSSDTPVVVMAGGVAVVATDVRAGCTYSISSTRAY